MLTIIKKILSNAIQDEYDETHHRSYPKSNHLHINIETNKAERIKGLNWEELVKISGIRLNVKNCIYVLNDRNELVLLQPQMLPIRFESRSFKPYEQCIVSEKADKQPSQTAWFSSMSWIFGNEPAKTAEQSNNKKIKYHITAQMASSLYLYSNDTTLLDETKKQLSSQDGKLLHAILNKISHNLSKGAVERVTPLNRPGFWAEIDESVFQTIVAIDKEQRAIFDNALTELINCYLKDATSFNSLPKLSEFCNKYYRQLTNMDLLFDLWTQVNKMFKQRKLSNKFADFQNLIIAKATEI